MQLFRVNVDRSFTNDYSGTRVVCAIHSVPVLIGKISTFLTSLDFSWTCKDAGGRQRVRPHHTGRRDPGLRRLPVRGEQRGAQGLPRRDQPDLLPTRQT